MWPGEYPLGGHGVVSCVSLIRSTKGPCMGPGGSRYSVSLLMRLAAGPHRPGGGNKDPEEQDKDEAGWSASP